MQTLKEVTQDCLVTFLLTLCSLFYYAACRKGRPSDPSEEHLPEQSRRARCSLETKQQHCKLLSSAQQSKNPHGHISFGG